MTPADQERLFAIVRETGFMRGINIAADIARKAGNLDLAVKIRSRGLQADTLAHGLDIAPGLVPAEETPHA